ncbi:STAS/SEC14 domain-containing protein [Sphingomicrobium astaxanthinifaciens]|uniref:STAS/SEC14 domain-containing protein n=1 Tax=Sphingomicrobium astaxanthinifaciens TaxID=1227949 RepID=UPI001FCB487F|nr:STAS/SEC14 domain-containing protein [Sphingomicrobium astaxanthinifaciens]MCJ7421258.1 STAS/SEC14 domain-containing protein [Sphingomicrobium astaxanthinifaciens]
MLNIDIDDPRVAILRPDGALTARDFDALEQAIDGSINAHDVVPSLVILLDRLPHWESLAAIGRHVHFIEVHGRVVPKVAVVGDSPLLALLPALADRLVATRLRRFPADQRAAAIAWARAEGDDPGRIEVIEGLPRDVVAVRLVGLITAEDYRDGLEPLIEAALADRERVKLLVEIGDDFAGFSPGAAVEDLRFGLRHARHVARLALVTDSGWIRAAARLFVPMWDIDSRLFGLAEREAAMAWVRR